MKLVVALVAGVSVGCSQPTPQPDVRFFLEVVPPSQPTRFASATLSVGSVRGVACSSAAWWPSPITSAHAHGGTGPDASTLVVSREVSLLEPARLELGVVKPPARAWCQVELEVVPSSATATSLLVEARTPARRYLSVATRTALTPITLPLDRPGEYGATLVLDARALDALDPTMSDARPGLLQDVLDSLSARGEAP